jgi:asparagine synthase (glutamine-hydrolysing)
MCGICGIAIPRRLQRPVDQARLTRMRDVLLHRGPDGAGMFIDGPIGLGHRRLSIVDVAHGAQPMTTDDGRSTIVYNGEVFNHPTLMAALQAEGVSYHTHCDTETVLHLYAKHGRDFVQHCRGMFAIAIWDRADQTLTIARDRFGVKPVYYVHDADGTLYFASEIKSLLAAGAVSATLDMQSFPDFLANHAPSGNDTLFAGVKRLPPGHTMRWKDGELVIEPYWDLSFTPDPILAKTSDADLVMEYSNRFEEAVRLRLMADVPLGMFLSGGIDSAAITAVMSDLVDGPIKTFSVAFAEREANELQYARLVSDRYRTQHHEIVVTPEQFWDALPQLIWHEDEPIAHPSSVALNFVSRLAGEHVKVVLTGEGSDETLAGYNRYRVTMANMQLGGIWEKVMPGAVRRALGSAIGEAGAPGMRGKFAVFAPGRLASLLSPDVRAAVAGVDPYAAYHDAIERSDAPTLLGKLLYADTKTYLHELLMKQDQMSMAASIESRVPFLDHPLAEFAARMPERMKLRGMTTKYVLRQAMKDRLPEEILSRKKMGFPVPVGAWFRGAWRHLLEEFVVSERALARGLFEPAAVRRLVNGHAAGENHSERLWALLTLEIWQRIFLDGEDPATIRMRPASSGVAVARPVAA